MKNFSDIIVSAYVWIVSVFLGAIILDIAYAKLLKEASAGIMLVPIFAQISDALAQFGLLVVITGVGAIVASWGNLQARSFFVGSLAVLFFEFLAPALLPPLIISSAHWLRIVIGAAASLLAIAGFQKYYSIRVSRDKNIEE